LEFRWEHGISEEVWRRRGYARYASADELIAIDPGYALISRGRVEWRTKVPGLAILRRPLPGTAGPTPLAELRPDEPLVTKVQYHGHDFDDPDHEHDWDDPFVPCHQGRSGQPRTLPRRKDCDRDHHKHAETAKYIFVPGELVERVSLRADLPWVRGEPFTQEVLDRRRVEQRRAEDALSERVGGNVRGENDRVWLEQVVRREVGLPLWPRRPRGAEETVKLGKVDIDGTTYELTSTLRKARESESMRVDINPLGLEMLPEAERIYLGLEGCIKADAILSAVIREGERASAVSVPSVTLWPRHADFYDSDLRVLAEMGKDVVLVVDADWSAPKNKGAVLAQASQVAHSLAVYGVKQVCVAGPPGPEKGADDYLATPGASLSRFVVIAQRDSGPDRERLQESFRAGQVSFTVAAAVVDTVHRRSNPHDGKARATSEQLAREIRERQPRERPRGGAPPDEVVGEAQRLRRADARQVRRTYAPIRRAGFEVVVPETSYGTPVTTFTVTAGLPGLLGTLGELGVPEYSLPDLRIRRFCEVCGGIIEGARRTSARLHPECSGRRRVQKHRDRRRS